MPSVNERLSRSLANKTALKDAVERTLLSFIALCMVGLIVLLFLQRQATSQELKNQQKIIKSQQSTLIANQKTIDDQTQQIKNYVLCIGEFFQTPNYKDKTLDVKTCKTSDVAPFSQPQHNSAASSTDVSNPSPTGSEQSKSTSLSGSSGSKSSTPPKSQPNIVQRVMDFVRGLL